MNALVGLRVGELRERLKVCSFMNVLIHHVYVITTRLRVYACTIYVKRPVLSTAFQ